MTVPRLNDEELIITRKLIDAYKAKLVIDDMTRSRWSLIKTWLGVFTAAATALTIIYHWAIELLKQGLHK